MTRVLLVEDNVDLAFGLRNNLEIEGYEVEIAGNGQAGLEQALRGKPDLLILDLMLPGLDGLRLLKALREEGLAMPVLILTAQGEEADKVRGLKLGADDYVTKPFGVLELLARVEALLRRGRAHPGATLPAGPQSFGDVTVVPGTRTVSRAGAPVELAPKEFDLLMALLARDGAVASRLELMREVWGYDDAVITRTIDTHVAELRRKLEADPAAPRYIVTVRKSGYRLQR